MRYCIKNLYNLLAIMIVFLSMAQSAEDLLNEAAANDGMSPIINEELADISLTSEVYEIDSNAVAVFGDDRIEPAKQEIYNVTVTNSGEVILDDVIVSISAIEGIVFKNLAYYDLSGNLKLECNQYDLCKSASTNLIRNLGTLESKKSKSLFIDAYVMPQVDYRRINVKAMGAKPNCATTAVKDIAEVAECVFVDNNGAPCREQTEGCICQRPIWAGAFGAPIPKPQIILNRINITKAIHAIEAADGEWYAPNSGNMPNIEGYIPNEGDQVIFQIIIANMDGNYTLRQIRVVDELPEGMIYISSSVDNGLVLPEVSGNEITWKIDEIKPKKQVIIKNVAAFHRIKDLRQFKNKAYAEGIWDTQYASITDRSQDALLEIIPEKQR